MKSTIRQRTTWISACIQRLFTPVFMFGIFTTVHGQLNENNPTVVVHKEIASQAFENVEVRGDIIVFLTNEVRSDITLQGDNRDINAVTTTENNDKLEINATKVKSASHLIVYLPASKIHSLKINGNTKVFSSGDVVVDDLAITLRGNSIVRVYHYGKLTVIPAQGYEVADGVGTY